MSANGDDEAPAGFASPPCFMHEIDPAYMNLPGGEDAQALGDVQRWRKAERKRLIEKRLALPVEERRRHDARINEALAEAAGALAGLTVSLYWPFRGEPNLHPFARLTVERGGRCALPVVVARGEPLAFRTWAPGDPLDRGVWNIPVPREDAEIVMPDLIVAPVVGFDRAAYRLGHGGGYYDRTLAAMGHGPRVLGVGYGLAAIQTIYPQWHDVAMDAVLTEDGLAAPAAADSGATREAAR